MLILCSINVLLFNVFIVIGSSNPLKTVFPNKTCLPMISTTFGIVIFVSIGHPSKISFAIDEIQLGSVTLVSDVHAQKARQPISVTLFGITMFVSDGHL